ncbi:anaerobic sulfatase maturase [Gibbsiella greigii]
MTHPFHLMAKPTSYQCNLACDYCFYLDKGMGCLPAGQPFRHMEENVLRAYIQQNIACSPTAEVMFAWQGGEPTLAGLDFYHRALAYQRQYANGKTIRNTLQTNGVLLDDSWAAFLAENQFLVGVSVDGPQALHDKYRKSRAGKSVFQQVIGAVKRLQHHRVTFNLLAAVNNETAKAPREIYHFLTRELGADFLQFIPIVERDDQRKRPPSGELIHPQALGQNSITPWSVSGEAYGEFLIAVFDEWVRHDVGEKFVQLFDCTLAAWMGAVPGLCVMQPNCGRALVIEQNGDIYSCDHFVYPEQRLGNILVDNLAALVDGKQQTSFGAQKSALPPDCRQCRYGFACHGGCPKHRILFKQGGAHNFLCAGYRAYFQHVEPYMNFMAQQLQLRRSPANVMANVGAIAAAQYPPAPRAG